MGVVVRPPAHPRQRAFSSNWFSEQLWIVQVARSLQRFSRRSATAAPISLISYVVFVTIWFTKDGRRSRDEYAYSPRLMEQRRAAMVAVFVGAAPEACC
jgi:hypothetical protein